MNTLKSVLNKLGKGKVSLSGQKNKVLLSSIQDLKQFAESNSYDKMNYDEVADGSRLALEFQDSLNNTIAIANDLDSTNDSIQDMYSVNGILNNISQIETLLMEVAEKFDDLDIDPRSNEDYEYGLFALEDMQTMLTEVQSYEQSYGYLIDTAKEFKNL